MCEPPPPPPPHARGGGVVGVCSVELLDMLLGAKGGTQDPSLPLIAPHPPWQRVVTCEGNQTCLQHALLACIVHVVGP